MKQTPVTFHTIASQRHLKLNDCLKEALAQQTSATPKPARRKRKLKNRPSFGELNLSHLKHHDRVLVTMALKASKVTHCRRKKQPMWQRGGGE